MAEPTEAGAVAVVRAIRCIANHDTDGMEQALRDVQADDPTGFATCYGLATYVVTMLADGDQVAVETLTSPAATAFDRDVAVTVSAIIAAAGNHDPEGAAGAFYGDEAVSGRVMSDLFRLAATLAEEAGHV